MQRVAPSSPGGCREDCELSLGRTRLEAYAALTSLRARRWADSSTRAVSVHFTLYNPPTRLFSCVTLSAELYPTGGLTLSSLVESVIVFHSNSAPRSHFILPELVFLLLTLTHLCFQLYRMAEGGVHRYWQKPGNWLELTIAGMGLACSAASGHLLSLAGEVTDQFRKGRFLEFMDLSHMASWTQGTRWLQGTLSFLLTLKCLHLLGLGNTAASCSFMPRPSLSGIFVPGLAGVLVLAAHAHLRSLFLTLAPPPGTLSATFHWLLFRFPGSKQRAMFLGLSKSDQRATAWCYVALLTTLSALGFRMLRGSLMTFARKRKSFQSKSLVRLKDVTAYLWGKACNLLRLERPKLEETELAENHNCYLEEFADLLDELLLKIRSLSDSPEPPLPEQQSCGAVEATAEDCSFVGTSADQATGGTCSGSEGEKPVHSSRRQPDGTQDEPQSSRTAGCPLGGNRDAAVGVREGKGRRKRGEAAGSKETLKFLKNI